MIPKECKRLAEVDFPIAVVSKHAAREKSIRHGHPSTLHLWWARRPLAACRAVLLALLLPDPCDEHCPHEFKGEARQLLKQLARGIGPRDIDLRQALLKFIGDFANWDLSADHTYLEVSRGLVNAAYGEDAPLVVDPFAGGGSIPLEALRLGCEAFASDINPVACLILKTMLEDIPRHGPELGDELRRVGTEIKQQAEKDLAEFYPSDKDGGRPIAYLWARTVRCERSDCGAEIPLVRTTWLAKRFNKTKKLYTKLVSLDLNGDRKSRKVDSQITVHETPTRTLPKNSTPTITGGKAVCPCCQTTLSDTRVRAQLSNQGGGSNEIVDENGRRVSGARLMVVMVRKKDVNGLIYRLPAKTDYSAIEKARQKKASLAKYFDFPSERLSPIRPSPNARGVSGATRIGITDFGKLFTDRQQLALATLSTCTSAKVSHPALQRLLFLAVSKLAERSSSFVTWINSTEAPRGTFARQALTIAWDFVELVPIVDGEEFLELIDAMANVVACVGASRLTIGQVEQAVASASPMPDDSVQVWFTDPPYYDSVPYADLSDLFYVWLKRMIAVPSSKKFDHKSEGGLTPKVDESTWNRAHIVNGESKTPRFFEESVAKAFSEGRRVLAKAGIGCVVFAHKTTEGWEALLSGMRHAGWVICASWPIVTERGARLNAKEAAALSASVHLVCRPRTTIEVGEWGEVYRELPIRVGEWIERLQSEGVRGADLVFACIGPAMEIYSRYSKVEDAEGREIPLGGDPTAAEPYRRGFLAYVWETVGRLALQQVLGTAEAKARNGAAGAIEEDARLTALFLWALQSTNGETETETNGDTESDEVEESDDEEEGGAKRKKTGHTLIFDVVRRFAQPLGIHLDQWEGRIIETEKGIVRLLPVSERTQQLFGEDGASAVATRIEQEARRNPQMTLEFVLPESEPPLIKGRGKKKKGKGASLKEVRDEGLTTQRQATTLDRVHAAMLLQSGGRANALRALLKSEQERGPDFLRLANALSALYPKDSEEKRLLDAMLLAVPR